MYDVGLRGLVLEERLGITILSSSFSWLAICACSNTLFKGTNSQLGGLIPDSCDQQVAGLPCSRDAGLLLSIRHLLQPLHAVVELHLFNPTKKGTTFLGT
ncbi:hypothetical protein CPB83DRAFT_853476 [Crepidotus variabilis]|uniref:Uncharacterized protein n=1 Tax=Crepidotus variabilis TaxID=179855 RepID=A0A9P6EH90_9AGAR|nr:hypothetical protein CPB83DRAFT_853476 [Crepidotus variabilis]